MNAGLAETIDGLPASAFTTLSAEQIADCRARAIAAGPFVDSALLRREWQTVDRTGRSWARVVLGRPFRGVNTDTWAAFLTLFYASELEPSPPVDPITAQAAAEAASIEAARIAAVEERIQRRDRAWSELRDALGVTVEVLYNYAGRFHTEFYSSGADHIVLTEALDRGALHRRSGYALCQTPSKHMEFAHSRDGRDDGRVPTCRACLRTAARLARPHNPNAVSAAEHLMQTSRRA